MKHTYLEIANFFGKPVARDAYGVLWLFDGIPKLTKDGWEDDHISAWRIPEESASADCFWSESLTVPSDWKMDPPFKVGQLVVKKNTGEFCIVTPEDVFDDTLNTNGLVFNAFRLPKDEEWETLRKGQAEEAVTESEPTQPQEEIDSPLHPLEIEFFQSNTDTAMEIKAVFDWAVNEIKKLRAENKRFVTVMQDLDKGNKILQERLEQYEQVYGEL